MLNEHGPTSSYSSQKSIWVGTKKSNKQSVNIISTKPIMIPISKRLSKPSPASPRQQQATEEQSKT